jgi:type I restriction enzyme, S subunit
VKTLAVGDICEFKYGSSLPERSRKPGSVPVYGSNGQVGFHSEALTDGPAIVVGRKGSIGQVNYSSEPCWPIDTTYFVDQSATKHDLRWLSYALSGLKLDELNKATGVPGLNRNDAYAKLLYVPPVEEQRRIAAILDQAEDLRRRRRDALERLELLIQADFVQNFYVRQEPNWPEISIAELSTSIRTGPFGSQLLHSEFTSEGVAVLGIDNAVNNEFRWAERRYISEAKYRDLQRYRVFPRDVLITIMGTCGRAAIVPEDIPVAINTKHLCCLTLDQERCLPEFLHASFLRHPAVLHQLGISERGAVMPGLNMGLIKETKLYLPPLDLQRAFASRVAEIDKLKVHLRSHLAKLDALFASLQHRAFRGEL